MEMPPDHFWDFMEDGDFNKFAAKEAKAFDRGREAGKHEAALETKYGSFRAHVQNVIAEARKVRDALEGDKVVDGLGAALNAHDDFLAAGQST